MARMDSYGFGEYDCMDEEYSFPGFEVTQHRETLSKLIPKLISAQREYLLFLNTIENYFRTTVIESLMAEFTSCVQKRPGLVELVQAHRTFVYSAADQQCLTERGSKILELLYRCVEAAIIFGRECRDLESSLELRDERLEEIISEKYLKIRRGLMQTRQQLCHLLKILQSHFKKGIEAKSRLSLTQ